MGRWVRACVCVFAQGQEGSRLCNLRALCNALNRLAYIRVRTCMHTHIVCEIVLCCLIVCMHNVIPKSYN